MHAKVFDTTVSSDRSRRTADKCIAGLCNRKPNVVMIMTDDVGWVDLGSYGGAASSRRRNYENEDA